MSYRKLPEYGVWNSMKQRCSNPNVESFPLYGGRGISVCPEWQTSFLAFYRDMGPRPDGPYAIERIDNDGDYCKANCCWATYLEQGQNKRNSRLLTHDGVTLTISEWARKTGLPLGTIWDRLELGWESRRVLGPSNWRMLTYNGRTQLISAWAAELGVGPEAISKRLRRGWSVERALTEPFRPESVFLTHEGVTLSAKAWSQKLGINLVTIRTRLSRGHSIDNVLKPGRVRRGSVRNRRRPVEREGKACYE